MARLFVSWQDLLFEQEGLVGDDGFGPLDQSDQTTLARRMYFMRGNSRTLVSARHLFKALDAQPTFRAWVNSEAEITNGYRSALDVFNRHIGKAEAIRHTIGAHAEIDLGNAIALFGPSDLTQFEVHSKDFIRPHLATDILIAAVSQCVEFGRLRTMGCRDPGYECIAFGRRSLIT